MADAQSIPTITDPRTCEHDLHYDQPTATVYCARCCWWWDADFETPPRRGNIAVTRSWNLQRYLRSELLRLNPDNEPTSEHMQWSEDR